MELILNAKSMLSFLNYCSFLSSASIDSIKTLAPLAISDAIVNSFGAWLIQLTPGTKINPAGAIRAISWAS